MADQFDERLKNWALTVADGAEVSLAPPQVHTPGKGVGLYLMELVQSAPISTLKPAPFQLMLRYLVTTWAEDPGQAHQMLANLLFAALEVNDFHVEREPIGIEVWRAFGVAPQPSFLLRTPITQERAPYRAKLVREPVKVSVTSMVGFYGLVVGPGDTPVSDCLVEIPALGLSARSDRKGRFEFAGLPASGTRQFVVKGRGRELAVTSTQNYSDRTSPMVINLGSLED